MGRPKGQKKTGGRKKGTPNKKTQMFRDIAEKRGFDCAEEWLNLYDVIRQAPEVLLHMDNLIEVLKQITMYIHPKPKEVVQLVGDEENPVRMTITLRPQDAGKAGTLDAH